MKQEVLKCLVLLGIGLVAGCEQKSADADDKSPGAAAVGSKSPDLLVRYHFIGTRLLLANPNVPTLKAIANLPETAELRRHVLRRVASVQIAGLAGEAGGAVSNGVAKLLPLMEEWLGSESYLEARGFPNRLAEVMVGVRLDEARVGIWKRALADFVAEVQLGTPVEIESEGFSGWEVKLKRTSRLLRFVGAGSWAMIGCGPGDLPTLSGALARCKAGGRPVPEPGVDLLTAEVNLPRVAEDWGLPAFFKGPPGQWPQVALTVNAAGTNVRTRMRLTYAEPLAWKLERWNLPTNTLRDPLISFTALQPLAPWLARATLIRNLGLPVQPNQLFLWAQTDPPTAMFGAVPVTDVTNTLTESGLKLPGLANATLAERNLGRFFFVTNRTQVVWDGLLALVPAMHAVVEPGGQFIVGTIFPPFPRTNPPPVELLGQFAGRTNLVYYDWEITQARLDQLRVIASLTETILRRQPGVNTAELGRFNPRRTTQKFLSAIVPHLSRKTDRGLEGESVTEVTLTNPRTLDLVRRSPAGLTALEFIALSWWLESPDFPRFGPVSRSARAAGLKSGDMR